MVVPLIMMSYTQYFTMLFISQRNVFVYFVLHFFSYSYRYSVVNGDRLSQKANPELYLHSNTGLQYKDSIVKLKNITQNLKSCSSDVANCPVKFCNLTVPRASDYILGTRYQGFTQSGFPTPSPMNVDCTVIEGINICSSNI